MDFSQKSYDDYSILIAEPDKECQAELAHILTPAGFKTYIAESGSQVLDILDTEAIHLLILDAILHGMGAFEILHMIEENFSPLPCILISDYISKEDQINALLSRVNTIFPKPVNFGLVRETVGHLIERYYIEGS